LTFAAKGQLSDANGTLLVNDASVVLGDRSSIVVDAGTSGSVTISAGSAGTIDILGHIIVPGGKISISQIDDGLLLRLFIWGR